MGVSSVAASVAVAVTVGALVGWSMHTVLQRDDPAGAPRTYDIVRAEQGSVGRTISLNARGGWSTANVLTVQQSGVVTSVAIRGAERVESGDELLRVNEQPVVSIEGRVPAFRDMTVGKTGADVGQLQAFLRATGYRGTPANGSYDAATARQVSQWQGKTGQVATGVVGLGTVVFIPELPARVSLGSAIRVGASLSGSADAPEASNDRPPYGILVLPAEPRFSITLPENQAKLVLVGQKVELNYENSIWNATIDRIDPAAEDGSQVAHLGPVPNKKTICDAKCETVPTEGSEAITALIQVVPTASGTVVPSLALTQDRKGAASVRTEQGKFLPVTVRASAGGRAVVDGVPIGAMIRVPGKS